MQNSDVPSDLKNPGIAGRRVPTNFDEWLLKLVSAGVANGRRNFGSSAVRAVVGYRAASEFPDADIADIGNADDERLSSCGVAAGGVH
jgi:hypothetical protein